jgi:hypothetical protein
MRTRTVLLAAVVVASVALFAATEVRAQDSLPTQCATPETPPKYTIAVSEVLLDVDGKTRFRYLLTAATRTDLQKITRLVIAFNRPGVTPDKIFLQDKQALSPLCTPDPATKVNLGNCESFQLLITPNIGTALTVPFDIVTSLTTRGAVTHNVNTTASQGAAISTCIATGDGDRRGIMGPGTEIDPNAPIAATTIHTVGACTVKVTRDAKGIITSVEAVPPSPPACTVVNDEGSPIFDYKVKGPGNEERSLIYVPEGTILGSEASPGCYDWFSGGKWYRVCS